MFRRILVPLDGSPLAEKVLPTVEALLLREHASAVLVRVLDLPEFTNQYAVLRDSMMAIAKPYLEDLAKRWEAKGIRVETRIAEGHAADAIISTAVQEKCELIAMSTHGRSGVKRFLLGSTAEMVTRHSPIPILAIRFGAKEQAAEKVFHHILVPLDGSPANELAVPATTSMASLYGTKVTLLHVMEPPPPEAQMLGESFRKAADEMLKHAAARLQESGIPVESQIRVGSPAEEILEFAKSSGADLICITTHGRSGIRRWLMGSVAERVLRHAEVPVLLLRR